MVRELPRRVRRIREAIIIEITATSATPREAGSAVVFVKFPISRRVIFTDVPPAMTGSDGCEWVVQQRELLCCIRGGQHAALIVRLNCTAQSFRQSLFGLECPFSPYLHLRSFCRLCFKAPLLVLFCLSTKIPSAQDLPSVILPKALRSFIARDFGDFAPVSLYFVTSHIHLCLSRSQWKIFADECLAVAYRLKTNNMSP